MTNEADGLQVVNLIVLGFTVPYTVVDVIKRDIIDTCLQGTETNIALIRLTDQKLRSNID